MSERSSTPIVDRAIWPLAAVVVVGSIMSILDTTIVNVALETLSVDLSSPVGSVQWVVTGYMLALAAVIPVTGWAARRIGTRRLYLMSLVLFTLGSVLCGFAWSIDSLIVFRVLQGLGGGMLMPTGMIILARAAGPQRIGRVLSAIGVPMVLAPVFGPVLGGLLVEHVGWRWIFFVNVPVGIVAVSLALRFLPAGRAEKAGPLDWLGVLLLSTGLPTLTYGLAKAGSGAGFASPQALVPIAAGLLLTTLFVFHSLRSTHPLLNVRLYGNRAFAAASATTFCLGATLFGALLLLPLYFQIVRHESVVATGLLLVPQSLGAAIAMPFGGRFTDRYGGGPVALVGVILTAVVDAPVRIRDRRHELRADRGVASPQGDRDRHRDDAGDERGLRGPPARADRGRDTAAHGRAARGRLDRHRRPRRCARQRTGGADDGRRRRGGLCDGLLVGLRHHARGDRSRLRFSSAPRGVPGVSTRPRRAGPPPKPRSRRHDGDRAGPFAGGGARVPPPRAPRPARGTPAAPEPRQPASGRNRVRALPPDGQAAGGRRADGVSPGRRGGSLAGRR